MELLGGGVSPTDMNSSQYDATARTEALADALGVRKTPRKAVEDMAPRNRGLSVRSNRNNRKAAGGNNNNNNVSLLSPLSRHPNDSHHLVDAMDTSVESRPPLLNKGPFSSLHPKFAVTCLYEDSVATTQAEEIFLASNQEGSGMLTLCLVCPGKHARNPNEVRLFSFEAHTGSTTATTKKDPTIDAFFKSFMVTPQTPIPCITAKPIHAFPMPKCFVPHSRNLPASWQAYTTDILLLGMEENYQMELSLYRSNMFVVQCALFEGHASTPATPAAIRDIGYSAGNRIDIVYETETGEEIRVRGCLPLNMTASLYGDRAVQALESALISSSLDNNGRSTVPQRVELALKIRTDCIRLEQALADERNNMSMSDGSGSTAVSTVVLAVFDALVQGVDVNNQKEGGYKDPMVQHEKSAWEKLLGSDFHQEFLSRGEVQFGNIDNSSDATFRESERPLSVLSQIRCLSSASMDAAGDRVLSSPLFDALYMLYEDYKLYTSSREEGMHFVGSILCRICNMFSGDTTESSKIPQLYLEHFRRDMGDSFFQSLGPSAESKGRAKSLAVLSSQRPSCIMSWIDGLVAGHEDNVQNMYGVIDLASINATCTRTRSIIRLYRALYGESSTMAGDDRNQRARDYDVVQILIEEGFTEPSILRDEVPLGVAVPLLEVLQRCRTEQNMPEFKDPRVLFLLGREDLRRNVQTSGCPSVTSYVAASQDTLQCMDYTNEISNIEDKDRDGVCQREITSSMLYPEDNRVREVGRLLRSSRPVYLSVERAIEVSDHEYERLKQDKLLLLSRRVLALPVGRGMLTVGNLQPVPAEPLPLPDLCLVGRVPPANAMLALDTTECAADLKIWPEFHNGVAAGLRLPLHEITAQNVSKITRTWIVYNRPPRSGQTTQNNSNTPNSTPSQSLGHAHGGLLMALGLRGHLTTLEMTDIFDYLTQGSVTTTVGVLLGMAAK
jgi:hypothetical protein